MYTSTVLNKTGQNSVIYTWVYLGVYAKIIHLISGAGITDKLFEGWGKKLSPNSYIILE